MAELTGEEIAGQLTQYFGFGGLPEKLEKAETELCAGPAGSLLFVSKADDIDRL